MNIGILTFHRAHNYGAVLQCYALQEYLKGLGHKVFVVDYQQSSLLKCYKPFDIRRFLSKNPIKCIRKMVQEINLIDVRLKRFRNFNTFITNRLNIASLDSLKDRFYDIIIIGSDQVWNTKLTHGFDPYYWGNWGDTHTKIVSYAASVEEFWDTKYDSKVTTLLNRFNFISVREEDAATKLKQMLPNKTIETVVDPTLLVEKCVWERIAIKPSIKENYLLLYQVRNSQHAELIAEKIASEMGVKIVRLSAKIDAANSKECLSTSPEEFVGWFKYASFVVCTSFHGSIFSLIFNKPFYSIKLNDGRDSRVKSLLKQVNQPHRLISKINKLSFECPMCNFNLLRANSVNFVNDCLK